MQHPSDHLIWQYVSTGHPFWAAVRFLPKQDALFFAFGVADVLSLWNPWTWDFALLLQRPIETTRLIKTWPIVG
jgi:hypothetical protein